ncbi:MAG: DUF1559 domain-containing protein [Planctomycetaceae bacterium]
MLFLPATVRNSSGGLDPHSYFQRLSNVINGDGITHTLLTTENLQATHWNDETLGGSGFAYSNGIVGGTNFTPTQFGVAGGTSGTALQFTGTTSNLELAAMVNVNLAAPEGHAPRPSSLHPGGVVASWTDSHTSFISENIDILTYLRMFTPAGTRYGEAVNTYTGD